MMRLGLTGSIGMGKSATAAMFAAEGVPVYDADRGVHALYAGRAVAPVEALFPGVAVDGRIDRGRLSARVLGDPAAMTALEAVIHPLVREQEIAFLAAAKRDGFRHAVLDIPLLFETGAERRLDAVVVVTATAAIQRARVLARADMSEAKFAAILAKQMPDSEKRRRAHFLVDSSRGFEPARRAVQAILRATSGLQGKG